MDGTDHNTVLGAFELSEYECIVCLTDSGDSYIVAQSDFMRERDFFCELLVQDNNFEPLDWDKDLTVGLYKLYIRPWSRPEEDDAGFSVLSCDKLWSCPTQNFSNPDSWLENRVIGTLLTPEEIMLWLLDLRKRGEWRVVDVTLSGARPAKVIHVYSQWEKVWRELRLITVGGTVGIGDNLYGNYAAYESFWKDPIQYIAAHWYAGLEVQNGCLCLMNKL